MAAGAEIIWVLEQTSFGQPGTAENCQEFLNNLGSSQGWCVGDSQTMPVPGSFDDSPFSLQRGFDIIVTRSDMEIRYATNHGTTSGNENISGAELLAEVQAIADSL